MSLVSSFSKPFYAFLGILRNTLTSSKGKTQTTLSIRITLFCKLFQRFHTVTRNDFGRQTTDQTTQQYQTYFNEFHNPDFFISKSKKIKGNLLS